jgi:hypothetical protein
VAAVLLGRFSYQGRLHYPGWYWSLSMSRLLAYESRLELARIMLADFDPSVAGIAAQPFLLAGADGTRDRRHVPDLLLVSADGVVTVVGTVTTSACERGTTPVDSHRNGASAG